MQKIHFRTIDSTNNYAKRLLANGEFVHGTLITADQQSQGRGRNAKRFSSDGGLYLSVLLKPTHIHYPLTCAAAVAVQQSVLELYNINLSIKWVNDLFFKQKKVCGILTEAQTFNEKINGFVCGIGINTADTHLPQNLVEIADILPCTDKSLLAETVATRLLHFYDHAIDPIPEYRKHLIRNVTVSVYKNGAFQFSGTALDVNENGNLIVRSENQTHILQSGEISIKL